MAGIPRNFQPSLKNVFLKIKKTCIKIQFFSYSRFHLSNLLGKHYVQRRNLI